MIIDEIQDFVLTGEKQTDHNTIFLKQQQNQKAPNKEKKRFGK